MVRQHSKIKDSLIHKLNQSHEEKWNGKIDTEWPCATRICTTGNLNRYFFLLSKSTETYWIRITGFSLVQQQVLLKFAIGEMWVFLPKVLALPWEDFIHERVWKKDKIFLNFHSWNVCKSHKEKKGWDYKIFPHITETSQIPGTEKANSKYLFNELMLNFLKI